LRNFFTPATLDVSITDKKIDGAREVVMANDAIYAAVLSNLSKAAEKQRLPEASGLLSELAARYPLEAEGAPDLAFVRDQLARDAESGYAAVRESATAVADRGALRAVTWGEKVTKTQKALADRYLAKGEELLEGKDLWVCESCGFIFLGEEAPDICPVCKAPSLRFGKVK
jgi:rubrerythrin